MSKMPTVMLTPEKQAAKRAALLKRLATLPEHLRLGVTLPGMRELLSELPSDAVEQINAKIPTDQYFNGWSVNGYTHQYFVTRWEEVDKLAISGSEPVPAPARLSISSTVSMPAALMRGSASDLNKPAAFSAAFSALSFCFFFSFFFFDPRTSWGPAPSSSSPPSSSPSLSSSSSTTGLKPAWPCSALSVKTSLNVASTSEPSWAWSSCYATQASTMRPRHWPRSTACDVCSGKGNPRGNVPAWCRLSTSDLRVHVCDKSKGPRV